MATLEDVARIQRIEAHSSPYRRRTFHLWTKPGDPEYTVEQLRRSLQLAAHGKKGEPIGIPGYGLRVSSRRWAEWIADAAILIKRVLGGVIPEEDKLTHISHEAARHLLESAIEDPDLPRLTADLDFSRRRLGPFPRRSLEMIAAACEETLDDQAVHDLAVTTELGLWDYFVKLERDFDEAEAPARGIAHLLQKPQNAMIYDEREWIVRFNGEERRFPDLKGFGVIAYCIAHEDEDLFALGVAVALRGPAWKESREVAIGGDLLEALGIEVRSDSHQPKLDKTALDAIRRHVDSMEESIEELRARGDVLGADDKTVELRKVREILDSDTFKGKVGSLPMDSEKARNGLRKNYKKALSAILAKLPSLARHLVDDLKIGTRCRYHPRSPMRWEISYGGTASE